MLTLCLLRHAKSSWSDGSLDDHARPLNKRGRADAPRMGEFIAAHSLSPDLIVCSTASRTRETLALVEPQLAKARHKVRFDDAIYEVPPSRLIEYIRRLPDGSRTALVIGHNPGMQGAALDLTGQGDIALIKKLALKFPTGTLAVLTFECNTWAGVRPGKGQLEMFVRPKDLDGATSVLRPEDED